MKKSTFILSLVSLTLTVAASAAVQNNQQNVDGVYTLPTFKVSTARYTEAEKQIEANLAELRLQARVSQPIRTELPSLGMIAQPTKADVGRSVAAQHPAHVQARS